MEIFGKNVADLIPGLGPDAQAAAPAEEQSPPENENPKEQAGPETGAAQEAAPAEQQRGGVQVQGPYEEALQDPFIQELLGSYLGQSDTDAEALLLSELERVRLSKMDFAALPDTDVIRMSLQKEWPELKGAAFERAVSKYMNAQFGEEIEGDEDDEDYASEKQIRDAQIRRKANEIRKTLLEEQSKARRKTPDEVKAEREKAQKKVEQDRKQWEEMVTGHKFISKALKTGEVEVGKPDQGITYKVGDTEKYKQALTNDPAFFELFNTGDAANPIDFQKWAKVVAYAMNPEGFEALLHASGKNAATGKILDELENPVKPGEVKPAQASSFTESLLGAISKRR